MATGLQSVIYEVAAALGNFATGGSLGSAAATVDLGTLLTVAQTTASQTVTVSNPTDTTPGKLLVIANIGSAAFTIFGTSVAAGAAIKAIWTGAAWAHII
jgi:hypothetical protein